MSLNFGPLFSERILRQKDFFYRGARDRFRQAQKWQEGILSSISAREFLGPRNWRWRLVFWQSLIVVIFLLYLVRLFQLQIWGGKQNLILAEENRLFIQYTSRPRGKIWSAEGIELARNRPGYQLNLVPAALPATKKDEFIKFLSETLILSNKDWEEIWRAAETNPFASILIKDNLTHQQQIAIRARLSDFPGLYLQESLIRDYPAGEAFSFILGYLGYLNLQELKNPLYQQYRPRDLVGREGVELIYEEYLRGSPGKQLIEVNAWGKRGRVIKEIAPQRGKDLVISIRYDLQNYAFNILQEARQEYGAEGAVFILEEVKSGRLLSFLSLPTYDNNLFTQERRELRYQSLIQDPEKPFFNRALAGLYPPGSVVKPIIAWAALEEGIINPQTYLSDLPQIIRIGQWSFPDWTVSWGRKAHGLINVQEAIAYSCDTFFYKIGGGYQGNCDGFSRGCRSSGLGIDKISTVYRSIGWGRETGIDLPGEAAGVVPDRGWKKAEKGEDWFLGDTYHLSIGQGDLLVTPLQVVNYMALLAQGKTLWRPRLGKLIRPFEGKEEKIFPQGENWLSGDGAFSLEVVQKGMRLAVTQGIIYPLREAKVSVAAKTGTAEFGQLNQRGEYQTHAWVGGYFPAEQPRYAFVVLLEAGGKSNNAARVARKIIDWIAEQKFYQEMQDN